jgi:hypothetical protein
MGILDWLRRKRDVPPRGEELHEARVDFYSNPPTFDVDFKRKKDKTERKIKTTKNIGSSDDFNSKSKLWTKKKRR